jgi:thiol:disulfide interchange protein DsbD
MRSGLLIYLCFVLLIKPLSVLAQAELDTSTVSPFTPTVALDNTAETQFLPVEQAYQLNTEFESANNNTYQLRLNWQIAEGYYLYRHGFNFQLFDGDRLITSAVQIPAGLEKVDDYFGQVEVYYHNVDITLGPLPSSENLRLTVTSQGCADAGLCYPPYSQHFQLDGNQARLTAVAATQITPTASTNTTTAGLGSLPYMLLLAMLGGVILNLMPCVFPVLSLKVLGFANDKNHSPAIHGATYTAGVITSFIVVAAILISLQTAGEAIGWGFHLQTPWFVAGLSYLFFVMGLSLSGYMEFGGQWMNMGGKLAQQSNYTGSFFTGILATVVASPCTAPFMGTALGFAITQPKAIALLVFAALGLGMALPVLLLSCSPKLLNKIPKAGPWMEQLKQFLAFPLYITAVWLCWVVGNQVGVNGMAALLIGGVLIALAIWLWRSATLQRTLAAGCVAAALSILSSPLLQTDRANIQPDHDWQAYSQQTLSKLRQQGKPVFINITADWCITCLANEKVTLNSERVKHALKAADITYLKGDWTNHAPEITQLLQQYGRNGIPLYLIYPTGNAERATVLPQILTVDTVLQAISTAVQPPQTSNHQTP